MNPQVVVAQPGLGALDLLEAAQRYGAQVHIDAYDGDVRREELALHQRIENLFADAKWKALRLPSNTYHRGRVLNKKLYELDYHNLVVTGGKGLILDRLFGLGGVGAMTRLGVGTSATAAALADTALTGSVFKAFDSTPTRSGTAVTIIVTFGTADANINWQEMGMDNGTTLLNRIAPIGPFNKTTAVSIVVTLTFTQN